MSAACSTCVETNCDTAYCTCLGDTTVDDAGMPMGCLAFTNCVADCVNGNADAGVDAGDPLTCLGICSGGDAGGAFTPMQVQEGTALLMCINDNCIQPPDAGASDGGDGGGGMLGPCAP
jgi:hypothetical protein